VPSTDDAYLKQCNQSPARRYLSLVPQCSMSNPVIFEQNRANYERCFDHTIIKERSLRTHYASLPLLQRKDFKAFDRNRGKLKKGRTSEMAAPQRR
jgi:hypothetical protein